MTVATETYLVAVRMFILVAFLQLAHNANASVDSYFGSIDVVDHTFAAGGGIFTSSVHGSADDAWIVFAARPGDNIVVTFSELGGNFYDGAIFREVTDGIVEVGDVANIRDLNFDRTGDGQDIVIQHGPFSVGCTGYLFGYFCGSQTVDFSVTSGGQYVIGITNGNELADEPFGLYTVTLAGNTASVPEPNTMALSTTCLLGLSALRLWRKRRRVN